MVTDLCFPVYANVTRIGGAEVIEVPLNDHLDYDLERMLTAINERTRVVFLASPNNPTGRIIPPDDIASFLQRLPSRVLCVLDLAYHEYTQPHLRIDPEALLRKHPNLVMLRTFSKVYGLAGLRVGYAIAASDVVESLDTVRIPFTTSTAAQVAARAALVDTQHVERSLLLNAAMRQRLSEDMAELGLKTIASEANFGLVDVRTDAESIFRGLLMSGVIVRPVRAPRLKNWLRVTTGTGAQMAAFADALAKVMKIAGL
jgi:histidinol-phosphate aminotransferase